MSDKKATLHTHCPVCGESYSLEVYEKDFDRWKSGVHVQDAFPYLDADDRERLISGICPKCWDKMFRNPAPSVNKKRRELGLTKKSSKAEE